MSEKIDAESLRLVIAALRANQEATLNALRAEVDALRAKRLETSSDYERLVHGNRDEA